MIRKILAVIGSSLTALVALGLFERIACAMRGGCVEDDASIRALAMFGHPLALLYVVGSWVTVYPAALALRRHLPLPVACLLPSLLFGTTCSLVVHNPQVDGSLLNTLLVVVPWLGTSWVLGALVALLAWPASGALKASAAAQ